MGKTCSLMREGHVVSHVADPNGERIDIVDIHAWCSANAAAGLTPCPSAAAYRRRERFRRLELHTLLSHDNARR